MASAMALIHESISSLGGDPTPWAVTVIVSEVRISACDEDIGVLIAEAWVNPPEVSHWAEVYGKNAAALVALLFRLGFTGPTLFERMTSPTLDVPGMNLYRLAVVGKVSVTIRTEGDLELQIVSLPRARS